MSLKIKGKTHGTFVSAPPLVKHSKYQNMIEGELEYFIDFILEIQSL